MNGSKKITLIIFSAFLLLVGVFLRTPNPNDNFSDRESTIVDKKTITIKSRFFASNGSINAPYNDMDVFTSPVQESAFEFTAVGGAWDEVAPDGTRVEAQIKFKISGKWTDWIDMEEEDDRIILGKKYGLALSNPATAFQYQYLLYGNGEKSPLIKNSEWTFIRSGENKVSSEKKPRYASFIASEIADIKSMAMNYADPEVISRSSWGANESYRYMADNNTPVQLVQLDPDFYNKYANELKYSKIVEADEKGDNYKWPLQYPEKIEKVVIHHTATTGNLDNPKQAMRDIYHYHAITRGWGDIGYNYVVDPQGNIYEGRYGGEGVIGAHAGAGNHGSIGISFLGDYEANEVPESALVRASKFIYKKAKIHNLDIGGSAEFRGKIRPNLFAHRDIMSTDCPGQYLYAKLPLIRILAGQALNQKPKFVKDYDFQDNSELYYLEVKPSEQIEVTLKLQNIGKNSWNNQTYIRFEDNSEFEGVVSFPGRQGYTLAKLQEDSVSSSSNGTFKFSVQAGKKAKTVYLTLHPIINGKQSVDDKITIPISVEAPIYKYEFIDAKLPAKLTKRGDTITGTVTLKNNGNIAWINEGEDAITLQGNSLGIIANLNESSVAPGGNGTFNFSFTASQKPGYYKEMFTPIMPNAAWVTKNEVSFETVIYEKNYDSELLAKTALKGWKQGESYTLSISLRNIGMETWNKKDLSITFAQKGDLAIKSLNLDPAVVAPGATGTITFNVKIPNDAAGGDAILLANPKINKEKITATPQYFYYKVVEKTLQTTRDSSAAGDMIRIKLGFSGSPEITANGSFIVRAGDQTLATVSPGDVASVSEESGQYHVQIGDLNFVKKDPIRFVPDDNAILKIKNFNHQPSWTDKLNDNEYRGVLEVRDNLGSLIVINELTMEDYLKGLGEVSNDEKPEKIKAIMVAARSYAEFYLKISKKFPGEPFDLDDNPDVSQKYLGYGLEKRSPNVSEGVDATKGEVITLNGQIVKTPFFNQSDGKKTKSAKEVWGWTNTPYLISVDDSYCSGDKFLGHGVGLSGCGARGMAEQGKDYKEILLHYYTGVDISDLY